MLVNINVLEKIVAQRVGLFKLMSADIFFGSGGSGGSGRAEGRLCVGGWIWRSRKIADVLDFLSQGLGLSAAWRFPGVRWGGRVLGGVARAGN